MATNLLLSGGPFGGDIYTADGALIADQPDNPGTVLDLSYDVAALDDNGAPIAVTQPCFYRVSSLTSKRIGGKVQTSGMATYIGETI